ncbi:hypothetical protein QBC47DRAFT_459679 [Echria macrotheca]|uniref:Rhodopsin domain-containing protein n=1 Tax=Echria macrotheca TaxID=438768 RepID=A0AAJ0BEW3_9PEZI|nr:hypothetical protein QBC47DRAFT_459679 [Echria macrotheca]
MSDFQDVSSKTKIRSVMIILAAIPLLSLLLRYLLKRRYKAAFLIDDYILLLAWSIQFTSNALIYTETHHALGTPLPLSPSPSQTIDIRYSARLLTYSQFLAVLDVAITKWAIALVLRRFTRAPLATRLIISGAVSVSILQIVWAGLVVGDCTSGPCRSYGVLRVWAGVASGWSAAVDFCFAILPWFLIWKLNLGVGEKVALCGGTGLGVFSGVAASIKMGLVFKVEEYSVFTEEWIQYIIWTAAETATIITISSIPFYRRAISSFIHRVTSFGTFWATPREHLRTATHPTDRIRPNNPPAMVEMHKRTGVLRTQTFSVRSEIKDPDRDPTDHEGQHFGPTWRISSRPETGAGEWNVGAGHTMDSVAVAVVGPTDPHLGFHHSLYAAISPHTDLVSLSSFHQKSTHFHFSP